jgi:hypothetical protein
MLTGAFMAFLRQLFLSFQARRLIFVRYGRICFGLVAACAALVGAGLFSRLALPGRSLPSLGNRQNPDHPDCPGHPPDFGPCIVPDVVETHGSGKFSVPAGKLSMSILMCQHRRLSHSGKSPGQPPVGVGRAMIRQGFLQASNWRGRVGHLAYHGWIYAYRRSTVRPLQLCYIMARLSMAYIGESGKVVGGRPKAGHDIKGNSTPMKSPSATQRGSSVPMEARS